MERNKSKIFISIALATYNGEKYLREQLDSILSQSIQDFELVACDDCSTDSTLKILNEYLKKHALSERTAYIEKIIEEKKLAEVIHN